MIYNVLPQPKLNVKHVKYFFITIVIPDALGLVTSRKLYVLDNLFWCCPLASQLQIYGLGKWE